MIKISYKQQKQITVLRQFLLTNALCLCVIGISGAGCTNFQADHPLFPEHPEIK